MLKTSYRVILFAALAASLSAGLTACTASGGIGTANTASPNPNASSSTGLNVDANVSVGLPNPLDIATLTGLTAKSCSEESGLKSTTGAATSINFKNSSTGKINIYWLDFNGKRVSYKQGLAAGASYQQSTYVTHPWVITNDQDQCMGVYTPSETGTVTLEVKKTVSVSGSGTATGTSGSTAITAASGTEARVRQGIACLNGAGKTSQAGAVQASLNLYLEAQKQGGIATILGNAHLSQAETISKENGC